jgi:hypothetical protein
VYLWVGQGASLWLICFLLVVVEKHILSYIYCFHSSFVTLSNISQVNRDFNKNPLLSVGIWFCMTGKYTQREEAPIRTNNSCTMVSIYKTKLSTISAFIERLRSSLSSAARQTFQRSVGTPGNRANQLADDPLQPSMTVPSPEFHQYWVHGATPRFQNLLLVIKQTAFEEYSQVC